MSFAAKVAAKQKGGRSASLLFGVSVDYNRQDQRIADPLEPSTLITQLSEAISEGRTVATWELVRQGVSGRHFAFNSS